MKYSSLYYYTHQCSAMTHGSYMRRFKLRWGFRKFMAKTGKDRKRQVVAEFRRSEILSAATKVFGSKGFEGTRMDDIAEEADLAKGTVYIYFQSKDEIYEAVVEQVVTEIVALTAEQVALATD